MKGWRLWRRAVPLFLGGALQTETNGRRTQVLPRDKPPSVEVEPGLSEEVGPGKCILKAFQDQYSTSFKNGVRAFVDGSLASPLPDADHVLQFEGFS